MVKLIINEIKEARIWTVATDPTATPAHKGAILYNSTDDVMKFCTGDKWVVLGSLDQMTAEADVSLSGFNLTDIGAPLVATDAASKGYVDNLINGLSWKGAVVAATTQDIALTGLAQVIDGVQLVDGDRVLVKQQVNATENGIYVAGEDSWVRPPDVNSSASLQQATVVVQEGTTHSDTTWTVTTDDVVLDTTSVTFTQTSGTNTYNWGTGLEATGNTINLFGQALAIHQLSANGLVVRDASGSFVSREVVGSVNTGTLLGAQVTNGSGVAGNIEIGIAVSDSGVGGNGVSTSLAREDHFHVAHTLQEVTDQGNATTNMIDITGGTSLSAGAPPTALKVGTGHMMTVGNADGNGVFWLTNDANPGLPNGGASVSIMGNGAAIAAAGQANRVFAEAGAVGMSFAAGASASSVVLDNDSAFVQGGDGSLTVTSAGAAFNTTVSGSDPVAASDFVTKSYLDNNTATGFVGLIGDASASTFAVTHSLGNQYVQFSVWEVSTNDSIECDVVFTDANTMQFTFTNYVPSVDGVRIVING